VDSGSGEFGVPRLVGMGRAGALAGETFETLLVVVGFCPAVAAFVDVVDGETAGGEPRASRIAEQFFAATDAVEHVGGPASLAPVFSGHGVGVLRGWFGPEEVVVEVAQPLVVDPLGLVAA